MLQLQVEPQKILKRKKPHKEKCELALEDVKCIENIEFAMLLDDEELELRELQAGPNPLSCSAHFPASGSRGCSLCKGLPYSCLTLCLSFIIICSIRLIV